MSTTFTVIKAIPKKNSVELVTTDTRFNKIVNFTDYSGGELTRLRIVVLMSVLNAVQTITNVSTNILVFDEALDTLDSNAAQDLSNLFEYLSNNDNKFVALVSHGSQLNEIKFDGDITVTKHNGVSNVTQGV
jgi:ABC-type multidrug transport system ATPase subunit